ncbi:pseudouridine synthase [Thiomicrorhabdus aquaedulcis]|uniref:pseudouridine synthase n=1 Tax=Thiomicrorhabdus aquaedulcis TaxID=2211106 RepID=UPI000FD84CAD|nr:pseudouridine synthase [Thiomicrorhabdus aquaedulcis]
MLSIIFKNADFVVVDKPSGLNFHSECVVQQDVSQALIPPDLLPEDATLDNARQPGLVVLVKQQLNCPELYPVHRLDKMTSGLVVFALNKPAAQRFGLMFAAHEVQKYYLAISDKKPNKKQGWVKGDMLSARRGSYKLAKTLQNPAITQFVTSLIAPKKRLFLVKPITGKTHQIRVALKSLAAPILGDLRYAERLSAQLSDRGYLHAYAMQFSLFNQSYEFVLAPNEGAEFLTLECQAIIKNWLHPWNFFSG